MRAPLLALALLVLGPGCASPRGGEDDLTKLVALAAPQPGELVVTFFETGLGDAILLELPSGKTLLVDAGVGAFVDSIATYLRLRGHERLDAMLLTHPHADHYGGMLELMDQVPVGLFLYNGMRTSSPGYDTLMREVEERQIPAHVLRREDRLDKLLGPGCEIDVLYPDRHAIDMRPDKNCSSIVLRVTYGTQRILLMGDAEELEEERLMALGGEGSLRADVLKLGHHGERGAGTTRFLAEVNPWVAIAMGTEGLHVPFLYPHPCEDVCRDLERLRAPLLCTGDHGPIQVVSDGESSRVITLRGRFLPWRDRRAPAPGPLR